MSNNVIKNKKKISLSETFKDAASGITSFFIFWLLAVFPLYTHDKYFDILGARYVFFKLSVVVFAICLIVVGVIYLMVDKGEEHGGKRALIRFVEAFKIENLKNYIKVSDVLFLLLILSMTISTLGSFKMEESFYGNAGRYQGLECWLIYIVLYICITRTYRFKKWHLDLALIVCAFASIWAVTDFFKLDIFGFLEGVRDDQKAMFASSVGNLNTLTNYTGLMAAVAIVCFIIEENPIRTVIYGICAISCIAGTVFGLSDNGVLSFMAIYMVTPFLTIKNRRHFVRFTISITFFTLVLGFLYWALTCGHPITWMDSFFRQLVRSSFVIRFFFVPMIVINIVAFLLCKKIKSKNMATIENVNYLDAPFGKIFKRIWLALIILSFALIIFAVIDYNFMHNFDSIWSQLPSNNQLKINDDWGTHRGHNWRIAFTNFKVFNPFHKLFGYGPDTYLVVTERSFFEEMMEKYNEVYDSAHNEYVNYLVCQGLVGLFTYLGVCISSIVYGIKVSKKNIFAVALIMGIISYMVQAVVNIAIPITTPIYFCVMFMAIGMYINNEEARL